MAQQDELVLFSQTSMYLSRLKTSLEYIQDFQKKFSKFMEPEDRVKVAKSNVNLEEVYWKQFQKFVNKIRGL